MHLPRRFSPWLLLALSLALAPHAFAQADAPPGDGLTGRDIYQRVLDNKLETSYMEHRILSTDEGGTEQTLEFWSRFKDYRVKEDSPPKGTVISKSVMRFTAPYDKRETAYLFVEKKGTENEGFHYSRKRTRVTRISTSNESIFGTDFCLDDLAVVRHIDDGTYTRHADETVQGVSVWVVEVFHKPESDPPYARSMVYVDKERNVPLRTRHWDDAGVEVKQLDIPREKIERIAGVWIPRESTMTDLSERTHSILLLDKVEPNVKLSEYVFEPKRLEYEN